MRFARHGERLLALNGREYELDPEITAIADDNGVQSLGGVIGGEPTGVTEETTEVYVEAALFDPIRTAATGRRLEIVSDARYRFERGIDPAFVGPGLEIATRLILELCGGEPSEIVRAGAEPQWRRTYTLRPERTAGLGGLHVPPAESRAILEALGCTVGDAAAHDGSLTVSPPSWRGDIEGEADLVEEVLRVKGYDEIPPVPLPRETTVSRPAIDARRRRIELVRRTLAERGLTEAVTFSFSRRRRRRRLFGGAQPELTPGQPDQQRSRRDAPERLAEPGRGGAAQRRSRLSGCRAVRVGAALPRRPPEGQVTVAAGLRAGRLGPRDWREQPREPDLYDAKADALAALAAVGRADRQPADRRRSAALVSPRARRHSAARAERARPFRRTPSGCAGGFRREGAGRRVRGVSRRRTAAARRPRERNRGRPPLHLSVFQPVERDFAFIVDRDLPAETLLRAARGVDRKLVSDIRLFDVYEGKGLPEGKKSLAIAVTLQPQEATLTDAEMEAFSKRLVAAVEKATGGTLRG